MVDIDTAAKLLLRRRSATADVKDWLFNAPLRNSRSSTYGMLKNSGSHSFVTHAGVQCVQFARNGRFIGNYGNDFPASAFTMCGWVQSDTDASTRKRFFCISGSSLSNTVWFDQNTDGKLRCQNANSTMSGSLTTPDAVDVSTWRHIAVTWSDGYLRMYVDGVVEVFDGGITGSPDLRVVYLNAIASATTNSEAARYHDVRVYPRALSAYEISVVMNATAT